MPSCPTDTRVKSPAASTVVCADQVFAQSLEPTIRAVTETREKFLHTRYTRSWLLAESAFRSAAMCSWSGTVQTVGVVLGQTTALLRKVKVWPLSAETERLSVAPSGGIPPGSALGKPIHA